VDALGRAIAGRRTSDVAAMLGAEVSLTAENGERTGGRDAVAARLLERFGGRRMIADAVEDGGATVVVRSYVRDVAGQRPASATAVTLDLTRNRDGALQITRIRLGG
jgi:hypothetical protein